jgi:hypothetical protein
MRKAIINGFAAVAISGIAGYGLADWEYYATAIAVVGIIANSMID